MKTDLPFRGRTYFLIALGKILRDPDSITWVLTAAWVIVMLVALMLPAKAIPLHMEHNEDKLYHFAMFSVLSALAVLSVRNFRRVLYLTNSSFVMAFGAGFSIVTEVAQRIVPGRTMSTLDGLANIAGVFAGIVLVNLVIFYRSKPRKAVTLKDLVIIKPRPHYPKPKSELRAPLYYDPGSTP